MKPNLLLDLICCYIAASIAFLAVPIYMIGYSPEDYQFINITIFIKSSLIFSAALGTLLGLICLALHLFKLYKISRYFAFFACTWILISGFIMPVSVSTAMIDPANTPVDSTNLISSLIVAGILSFAGILRVKKYLVIFSIVVVLVSTVPAIVSIYNSEIWANYQTISSDNIYSSFSDKKNILVVSFDGVPGDSITSLIKNNISYSKDLKDFIIFNNAISQADGTAMSQTGVLFGTHDFKSKADTQKDLDVALTNEGLSDKLLLQQVPDSYQYRYRIWGKTMNFATSGIATQSKIDTIEFFQYPLIRIGTQFAHSLFYSETLTRQVQKHLIDSSSNSDFVFRVQNTKGPKWDKKNIMELEAYNEFVRNIFVADKDLSVKYLHFTFTHFPIDFDENCNFRSDDKEWYIANQNEKGIRGQGKCVLSLITDLIKNLKELGIYDNSLIVFKSDHGKPTEYYCEYPNNQVINGNRRHGFSRFRPTLMIKDFNAKNSSVIFQSQLVLLNDLALTICKKAELDSGCKSFPGVNLLGDNIKTDAPYYLYVVKDSKSKVFFRDHLSVKIPSRKLSLIEAMEKSNLINTSTHGGKKDFTKRMSDLKTIQIALSKYYRAYGKYPESPSWRSTYNDSGIFVDQYITGLVPEFLNSLPTDPRDSKIEMENYLYMSDGDNFKFIVHEAPIYDICNVDKNKIDPRRSTRAYGVWSKDAKNW